MESVGEHSAPRLSEEALSLVYIPTRSELIRVRGLILELRFRELDRWQLVRGAGSLFTVLDFSLAGVRVGHVF